jgi:peptidyl-prolyl cis-trans isomerase D
MLDSIRRFSNTIYAKILLGIVVIPFVFWGMGDTFSGGNKNIVVTIDKDKYSTQEFVNFIKMYQMVDQKIDKAKIEEFLTGFIGDRLIEKEIEDFNIVLSDVSLSKLIKNQKDFKRDGVFSRPEYEKFLLKNNISAAFFESNLARNEKKKQLLDIIGGGILPSLFLVDDSYNNINREVSIEYINLNNMFKNKLNISEEKISNYYNNNIKDFETTYKSIKLIELNPNKLTSSDDYNDLFFKKLDEIDDMVAQGNRLDFILENYNLGKADSFKVNSFGKDINSKPISENYKNVIKEIFKNDQIDEVLFIENEDKYFVIETIKTEEIKESINTEKVKTKVIENLKLKSKRKILSVLIAKINQNKFTKVDFNDLSRENTLEIKKLILNDINDNSVLKAELVAEIYKYPEKRIILANDIGLSENFLVFIDKVKNVNISKESEDYKKYSNLSKIKMTNTIFNTYDNYIKTKYKIVINSKSLDVVKNYFN